MSLHASLEFPEHSVADCSSNFPFCIVIRDMLNTDTDTDTAVYLRYSKWTGRNAGHFLSRLFSMSCHYPIVLYLIDDLQNNIRKPKLEDCNTSHLGYINDSFYMVFLFKLYFYLFPLNLVC